MGESTVHSIDKAPNFSRKVVHGPNREQSEKIVEPVDLNIVFSPSISYGPAYFESSGDKGLMAYDPLSENEQYSQKHNVEHKAPNPSSPKPSLNPHNSVVETKVNQTTSKITPPLYDVKSTVSNEKVSQDGGKTLILDTGRITIRRNPHNTKVPELHSVPQQEQIPSWGTSQTSSYESIRRNLPKDNTRKEAVHVTMPQDEAYDIEIEAPHRHLHIHL